jgi:hypothetical protein
VTHQCTQLTVKVATDWVRWRWWRYLGRYCHVHETNNDPDDLYLNMPPGEEWNIDPKGAYIHYTAADTRQGLEFQDFPYHVVPEGMPLVCDASANLGSKPVDVSKYAGLLSHADFLLCFLLHLLLLHVGGSGGVLRHIDLCPLVHTRV